MGILSSGNFWATHYRFLNDLREGSLLIPKIESLLETRFLGFFTKHKNKVDNDAIKRDFGTVEALAKRESSRLAAALFDFQNKLAPSFVVSFCRHDSEKSAGHGLLSQWRGYASGGYCIVVNKEELLELIKGEQETSLDCSFAMGPVDYHNESRDDITEPFDKIFERLVPALLQGDRNANEIISELYPRMLTIVPFVKDGGFSEESEFRIVLQPLDIRKLRPDFQPTRPVKHREYRGTFVPYVTLFEKTNKLPIERIIVGPSDDAQRRAQGLVSLLASLELDVRVSISDIPYLGP